MKIDGEDIDGDDINVDTRNTLTLLRGGDNSGETNPKESMNIGDAENGYNVLFIGGSGNGKSAIVNALHNFTYCVSREAAGSITKDVDIVFSTGLVRAIDPDIHKHVPRTNYYREVEKTINCLDTQGFCDTSKKKPGFSDEDVYNMIKSRLKLEKLIIHHTVIVSSMRLENPDWIIRLLELLDYQKHPEKFTFVNNNKKNQVSPGDHSMNRGILIERFGIKADAYEGALDGAYEPARRNGSAIVSIGNLEHKTGTDEEINSIKKDLFQLQNAIFTVAVPGLGRSTKRPGAADFRFEGVKVQKTSWCSIL